ncbi:MAG: hypothetical protein WC679_04585 [Bacteroidales bacterium]|jgi:gliding motility-associated lipoprotein GldH
MRKTINYLIIALFFCLAFVSCGKKQIYEKTVIFPNQTWERIENGKDVKFEKINVKSKEDAYDINISFRHKPTINVDEISFILRIISPSGMKKESIHTLKLKDRYGKKYIGKNLGEEIDIKEPIKQYFFFPEVGEYTIVISNYCEKYEVNGLSNIGIEIVKSDLDYEIEK